MKLIFATNNNHKVAEIQAIISNKFQILSLKDAGIDIDIPEPHNTLEENASEKSRTIYKITNINCFSEDTGLEVEALYGEPGVKSARYSGEDKAFDKNIDKLLLNMEGKKNRKARFRTVISLIIDGTEAQFEGIADGEIISQKKGHNGFGYDSVFMPTGSTQTFAEMNFDEKNKFSHRSRATIKLITFLNNLLLKSKN